MSTEMHPTAVDVDADDHGHGATDKQYIIIALILALITAAEVAASYMDLGAIFIPALLIMMVAKFFIVVSYFMHLKFEGRWVYFMLVPAGVLATIFVLALYPDIGMQPIS